MQPCPVCPHIPTFLLYDQQLNEFPSFVFEPSSHRHEKCLFAASSELLSQRDAFDASQLPPFSGQKSAFIRLRCFFYFFFFN